MSVNEEQNLGEAVVDRKTGEIVETPLDRFRRSAGFQFAFVLHSGLEIEKAIDHLCSSAQKYSAALREWQPIETAPKMRNVILFAVTDHDPYNWKMDTGYFSEGADCWVWSGYEVKAHMIQPTHWMPIPEPPCLSISDRGTDGQAS